MKCAKIIKSNVITKSFTYDYLDQSVISDMFLIVFVFELYKKEDNMDKFEAAKERFAYLLEEQYKRVERMKNEADFVDYT